MKNEYYLYIDDSGKFKNPKDNHVVYSFVLLNKIQKRKFEEVFSHFRNALILEGEEEIKGQKILNKLNRKSYFPIEKYQIESMIESGKEATLVGSVIWCKNKSKYEDTRISSREEFYKKLWMISTIIKKAHEKKQYLIFQI
ncbi:MAG: hypothetical protein ACRCUM_00855 [Mycoplasmoidaceae bacterium]